MVDRYKIWDVIGIKVVFIVTAVEAKNIQVIRRILLATENVPNAILKKGNYGLVYTVQTNSD